MPKLIFHDSDGVDKAIDLGAEPTLIGRAAECQVQTQDALVSRRHARIVWDGGYWIEDLGSSNGVFVGSERVQRAPFRPGDEVRCGSLVMRLVPDTRPRTQSFSSGAPPEPATVKAPPLAPPSAPPAPPAPAVEPAPVRGTRQEPSAAGEVLAVQLEEERARRIAAEAAVLQAEQRAASAEGRLQDAEARADDAEARAARGGGVDAATAEQARQAETYRRQVDQLRAELRRVRGGAGDEVTSAQGGPSPAMVAELAAERDRLRQRVAELEAGRGATGSLPAVGDDAALLRRRVDQLTAEVRRLRGGLPPEPAVDDGRLAELEARAQRAERERDEARAAAASRPASLPPAPAPGPDLAPELDRLRRMNDQLAAENRRLRQGEGAPALAAPPAVDLARVAELEARVARAEAERDQARAQARSAPPPAAAPRLDPGALEVLGQADDALADLRGSLRAATDEVGVLGVEAPSDSVQVLRDALASAAEQMESARGRIKDLRKLLA